MAGVTAKHIRFAQHIADGVSGTEAALLAGYSPKSASAAGVRLRKSPTMAELIKEQREIRANVSKYLNKEWVINRWIAIARADPNELMQHRRVCCRYCHGENHNYQWTEKEYESALNSALDNVAKDGQPAPLPVPDLKGGLGYTRTLPPSPTCPECSGEGESEVFLHDSRGRSPLYKGAKQTKNGIEIMTYDQEEALANIAAYLGMTRQVAGVNVTVPIGIQNNLNDGRPVKEMTEEELTTIVLSGNAPPLSAYELPEPQDDGIHELEPE